LRATPTEPHSQATAAFLGRRTGVNCRGVFLAAGARIMDADAAKPGEAAQSSWAALPYEAWGDTCTTTLHL